jgi:parallel beta-helix repeat protein
MNYEEGRKMRRISFSPMLYITLILGLLFAPFAHAATLEVGIGKPYTTIQSAINAAVNGDTVLVYPLTYTENIDFNGKEITVRSVKGAASTIIDGKRKDGSVIVFMNNEGPASVIDGFTIINGSGTLDSFSIPAGGGIYCYNSSPTITNCTITGNTANGDGGGIYCEYSSPVITNCTITENRADGYGGGIECAISSPTLKNTILWGDTAPDGKEIYLDEGSTITLTYSDVEGGWTGTGNIDAYPLFVGNGNYHLTVGSPCIDKGTSEGAPAYDTDGDPRPQGAGFDIGSDEYTPASTTCSIWSDVISKYNAYVSGQVQWNDVIDCYNQYVSP